MFRSTSRATWGRSVGVKNVSDTPFKVLPLLMARKTNVTAVPAHMGQPRSVLLSTLSSEQRGCRRCTSAATTPCQRTMTTLAEELTREHNDPSNAARRMNAYCCATSQGQTDGRQLRLSAPRKVAPNFASSGSSSGGSSRRYLRSCCWTADKWTFRGSTCCLASRSGALTYVTLFPSRAYRDGSCRRCLCWWSSRRLCRLRAFGR